MFLNINNDLNYLMQKSNGNAEDRRKYDEFVISLSKIFYLEIKDLFFLLHQ
jgi:hypothetical protein